VTEDIKERFNFNTAISAIMEFVNDTNKFREINENENKNKNKLLSKAIETTIVLLAPFSPYLSEELWNMIGNTKSVHDVMWPKYEKAALIKDEVQVVIQVNGKVRDKMMVGSDLSKEDLEKEALESERIKNLIEGKTIRKVIVVPKKLVNIVAN
ncbi:MAG: class I tRNA ligase family protein, partial [Senegalia sp. (in: firmicutes)]